MPGEFDGASVVITGAGRGLGDILQKRLKARVGR